MLKGWIKDKRERGEDCYENQSKKSFERTEKQYPQPKALDLSSIATDDHLDGIEGTVDPFQQEKPEHGRIVVEQTQNLDDEKDNLENKADDDRTEKQDDREDSLTGRQKTPGQEDSEEQEQGTDSLARVNAENAARIVRELDAQAQIKRRRDKDEKDRDDDDHER